jgi:hypothetical protein
MTFQNTLPPFSGWTVSEAGSCFPVACLAHCSRLKMEVVNFFNFCQAPCHYMPQSNTVHSVFYENLRCNDTSVPKVLTFLLVSLLNERISYCLPHTTCIVWLLCTVGLLSLPWRIRKHVRNVALRFMMGFFKVWFMLVTNCDRARTYILCDSLRDKWPIQVIFHTYCMKNCLLGTSDFCPCQGLLMTEDWNCCVITRYCIAVVMWLSCWTVSIWKIVV